MPTISDSCAWRDCITCRMGGAIEESQHETHEFARHNRLTNNTMYC